VLGAGCWVLGSRFGDKFSAGGDTDNYLLLNIGSHLRRSTEYIIPVRRVCGVGCSRRLETWSSCIDRVWTRDGGGH